MKKSISLFLLLYLLSSSITAFEWPITQNENELFMSYYGQKRGNQISSSILFSQSSEIETVEKGKTLIIFEEEDYFFPSTLGSSVIICHDDKLASVYANLDKETMKKKDFYEQGEVIASSGNSSFQEKNNSLELQILDLKNNCAINPMILLPRNYEEKPIFISNLKLRNKNGSYFDISDTKYIASGTYKIYKKRNETTTPFKTSILVNGIEEDSISFDSITQENNKIFVSGKKKYSSSEVYPDDNMILLGEVFLPKGKCTIVVSISNVKEVIKSNTYNINAY